jgi:uncharacterized membrane protein YobD (UPF0266 family)
MIFKPQTSHIIVGKDLIYNGSKDDRMISITAFLVGNNTFQANVVAWLLPTVIVVPLIIFWIRKFKINKTKSLNQTHIG